MIPTTDGVHAHTRRRTFQTPPGAAAPCRLWNYMQAIIRSACTSSGIGGVHKHPCCFSVLLPAVKQQGAPVEPTQACPPLGSPSPCLHGGRHTHIYIYTHFLRDINTQPYHQNINCPISMENPPSHLHLI